jgi:hypothetical protein
MPTPAKKVQQQQYCTTAALSTARLVRDTNRRSGRDGDDKLVAITQHDHPEGKNNFKARTVISAAAAFGPFETRREDPYSNRYNND